MTASVGSVSTGQRARARFWRWSRHSSVVYPVVLSVRRRPGRRFVGPRTDVVIDGFERSGNTFAYFAFLDANGDRYRVGHHTHSTAQLRWARRLGVPTVVPVREPGACVLSAAIRWPERTIESILEDYIAFHRRVADLTDACFVADFDSVTSGFGAVIEAVNRRFGTDFTPFADDDGARERVFTAIDHHTAAGLGHVDPAAVPRPSAARAERRADLEAVLADPAAAVLLDQARTVHRSLVSS